MDKAIDAADVICAYKNNPKLKPRYGAFYDGTSCCPLSILAIDKGWKVNLSASVGSEVLAFLQNKGFEREYLSYFWKGVDDYCQNIVPKIDTTKFMGYSNGWNVAKELVKNNILEKR